MSTSSLIIQRAAELLAASPNGNVSTRSICEAAGVGQPVMYRIFGDKEGLLAAVADYVWGEYLDSKRTAVPSADPLQDVRDGWDNHTAFALAHPHAYRLVFATTLSSPPDAAEEAMNLLQAILERLAAQGRLRMSPAKAARIVMAANSGIALSLILRPSQFSDPSLSAVVRETTLNSVASDIGTSSVSDAMDIAAVTLKTGLASSTAFTPAESGLLAEWLTRIQTD
ncbi:MAG: TetR/AcrR family transcriptional regulator [Brevibacterium sp.]|uniref:TetR/AcrR family transcriptional regulator n=1 Tax=Brevibacterium sp. TaxID=1701 RepID=UPI002647871E|nr:TetR/AcrR family transcriptional regulator [Brevibacterium sp.]MDN5806239.1 TetR/AcrR family transcriptional regulator [Brevibacterium sp.]MDN5832767.1 TetR/AcrR family transcriptional regulator [Brevibacterium sp.]MDN5875398.1 TetR/AcrR family transcriptional regulator [Brevibacterium sp.]MDN5908569.1 TetR/AcrR family transcriptional regulator [Brevibacterium sp.]MDN6124126.1 TetR/AcrR family transcriptional regulator [Brevibacterium sp.]